MNDNLKFGLQLELNGEQVVVRGLGNVRGEVRGFTGEVEKTTRQTERQSQANKNLSQSFNTLKGAIAAVGVGYLFRQTVSLTDQYNVLDQRVKTATRSTGDYLNVQRELFAITQRNGAQLASTVELFQSLARTAPELNATNSQILTLTNLVQQLGVIGGSTNEQMKNGLLQFSQAMAGGIVRAEEFNSLIENTPELANRIASGLGKTVGQLRNAVLEGEVLSKDVFDALLKQAPEIAQEFEEIPLSVERATTMLANSVARALGLVDDKTTAMQGLAEGIQAVSQRLDALDPESIEQVLSVAEVLAAVIGVRLATSLATSTGLWAKERVAALAASAGYGTAGTSVSLYTGAITRLTTAQKAHNLAMLSMRGLLGLIGGPVGLAVTAATGIYLFRDALFNSKAEVKNFTGDVDELIASMKNLGKTSAQVKLDEINEALAKVEKEIADQSRRLNSSESGFEAVIQPLLNQAEALRENKKRLEDAIKTYEKAPAAISEFVKGLPSLEEELGNVATATGELTDEQKKLAEQKARIQETYQATVGNLQFETELLKRELSATIAGGAALEAFNREKYIEVELRRANAKNLLPEEVKRLREEIAARYDAEKALGDYQDKIENVKEEADPFADAWEEATKRIDESFADAWEGAFDSFEDFADSLKNSFKRLLAELAHQAVTKPILVSLGLGGGSSAASAGGLLSNITGGGSGGGGLLSGVSNIYSAGKALLSGNPLRGIGETIYTLGANTGSQTLRAIGSQLNGITTGGLALSTLGGLAGSFVGTGLGEGLFGKQANSNIGSTVGAIGGALLGGPIGAFFGGTLGGFLDGAFGGDGKKRVNLAVATGKFGTGWAPNQAIQAESGLWLTPVAKRVGGKGAEAARELRDMFASIDAALLGVYNSLGVDGIDLSKTTLPGKGEAGHAVGNLIGAASFNRVDTNQLKRAPDDFLNAWISTVNEMTGTAVDVQPLLDLSKEGELLADTLIRVQQEFAGVQDILGNLGFQTFADSITGMVEASKVAASFGGIENLSAATGQYYDRYYSEEEKLARINDQLVAVIGELNLSMPETRMEFRSLVESFDLTTQSGRDMFATMLTLAPAFDQVITAGEATVDVVQDIAKALNPDNFASRTDFLRAHFTGGGTIDNIPGFASGGYHAGGLRVVGETGPELEFTGPSYIANSGDTSRLLDNSEVVAELRALRAEVERMRGENRTGQYQIAKNTLKSAKIADRWENDGLPETRSVS